VDLDAQSPLVIEAFEERREVFDELALKAAENEAPGERPRDAARRTAQMKARQVDGWR
jgi:hypothetical protein